MSLNLCANDRSKNCLYNCCWKERKYTCCKSYKKAAVCKETKHEKSTKKIYSSSKNNSNKKAVFPFAAVFNTQTDEESH